MNNASRGVSSLSGEREFPGRILVELNSPGNNFVKAFRPFADHEFNDVGIALPIASPQRIGYMLFKRVGDIIQDDCDTALGVFGVRFAVIRFSDDGYGAIGKAS